jgi:hypothetical protein
MPCQQIRHLLFPYRLHRSGWCLASFVPIPPSGFGRVSCICSAISPTGFGRVLCICCANPAACIGSMSCIRCATPPSGSGSIPCICCAHAACRDGRCLATAVPFRCMVWACALHLLCPYRLQGLGVCLAFVVPITTCAELRNSHASMCPVFSTCKAWPFPSLDESIPAARLGCWPSFCKANRLPNLDDCLASV